jgi:hypothetical protein
VLCIKPLMVFGPCARQLRQQNVDVISEKPNNPAAIAIGLGLLAALLLSRS